MKFKFISETADLRSGEVDSKITLETDQEGLHEVVEEFENFLRGCGYFLEGKTLEVVDNE